MVSQSGREREEDSILVKLRKTAMTSKLQNKDACEKELNFTIYMDSSCNIEERRPESICVSVHFRGKKHKLSAGRLPVSWGRMCGV